MNFKKFILFIFTLCTLMSKFLFAQTPQNHHRVYGTKFLILYEGISEEETLSALPPDAEFQGDFRSVVGVGVAREYNKLQFIPKAAGLGTLSIHDRKGNKIFEYRIEVRKSALTKIVREVRALLADVEGITIKIVNNRVVIDGKVLFAKELSRIFNVMKQYGGQVTSMVEMNPLAEKKIAEMIEREINNPEIQVQLLNGKYVLKGAVDSQGERDRAEIIAKTFVPPPVINEAEAQGAVLKRKEKLVINLLSIKQRPVEPPTSKTIQIAIHYVELSKDYARSSRFQWVPALEDQTEIQFKRDPTTAGGLTTTLTGIISNLLPKLNWAKNHSYARILETTSTLVQEGETSTVSKMQDIPFTTTTAQGAINTNFKPVGISMTVKPKISNPRSDLISLDIDFTVGAITGQINSNAISTTNKVQTKVDVRSGYSAAIAGLIKNDSNTNYNRAPPNLNNALISLYASKEFQRGQSQFVVFVTPVIKATASQGAEAIKEKFKLAE